MSASPAVTSTHRRAGTSSPPPSPPPSGSSRAHTPISQQTQQQQQQQQSLVNTAPACVPPRCASRNLSQYVAVYVWTVICLVVGAISCVLIFRWLREPAAPPSMFSCAVGRSNVSLTYSSAVPACVARTNVCASYGTVLDALRLAVHRGARQPCYIHPAAGAAWCVRAVDADDLHVWVDAARVYGGRAAVGVGWPVWTGVCVDAPPGVCLQDA